MLRVSQSNNEVNIKLELKSVENDLKQLSIEAIEVFQQLKLKGVISEEQYRQMVKEKQAFIAGLQAFNY